MSSDKTDTSDFEILGIEFIELLANELNEVQTFLESYGFSLIAQHRRKRVYLFKQGAINIIVNCADDSIAKAYLEETGISIYAICLKCSDAIKCHTELLKRGGWNCTSRSGPMELNIPGIEGVGGTQIYLVDQLREDVSIYEIDFKMLDTPNMQPERLSHIDHLSIKIEEGRLPAWMAFFKNLLGFEPLNESTLRIPGKQGVELSLAENIDNSQSEYFDEIGFKACEVQTTFTTSRPSNFAVNFKVN